MLQIFYLNSEHWKRIENETNLDGLAPGVNFINIMGTNFSYERRFSSYVLTLLKNSYKNRARIRLMKLTTESFKFGFCYLCLKSICKCTSIIGLNFPIYVENVSFPSLFVVFESINMYSKLLIPVQGCQKLLVYFFSKDEVRVVSDFLNIEDIKIVP